MRAIRLRSWTLWTLAPLLLVVACSGGSEAPQEGATSAPAGTTALIGGSLGSPGGGSSMSDPDTSGEPGVVVMSSQEICDTFTATVVGDATGVAITGAETSRSSTPQCSYPYGGPDGPSSEMTIASMDSSATGGASDAQEAFDFVLEINRSLAAGSGAEEVTVDAGDRAVRLTGTSLHLGIISVDGKVLTVIVPLELTAAQADDLLVAIGRVAG